MIEPIDVKHVWFAMSAIAGSVSALAAMKYKEMSWPDICFTLFVGAAFAVFVMPWVAKDWIGIDEANQRAQNAMVYMGGTGWNVLMPLVLQKVKALAGMGEKS